MIKTISKWWNKEKLEREALQADNSAKKERMTQLVAQLESERILYKQAIDDLTGDITRHIDIVGTLQAELDGIKGEYDKKLNGELPWLKIETGKYDKVRGLEVELDWNEALIQYLREAWEGPKDDRIMVQKYIAMLYEHLIERLEVQIVDEKAKPDRVNDFE